jgi:LuxR family maltose regulon positive regulatory protein
MQPYGLILTSAAVGCARICHAKGDSAKAFDLLDQVKPKLNSPDKSLLIKRLDADKAYLSFKNDCIDEVDAWLQTCKIKHIDIVPLYRIGEYFQLVRVLTEKGSANEALLLLDHLYQLVCDEDRLRDKVKVSILQSIAFHQKGDELNAIMKLEAALELAEPGEFIRSFIDEGARMADLLLQYLHQRQHQFISKSANISLLYVKKLLLLMQVHVDETFISGSLLTVQELKIVRMIEAGLSNKQAAQQNQVTAETVKSHLKNIYRKLNVNSRWQAVQRSKELNLL